MLHQVRLVVQKLSSNFSLQHAHQSSNILEAKRLEILHETAGLGMIQVGPIAGLRGQRPS